MHNKWLNPANFKTNEEFVKAYNEVHGRMLAFNEIYTLLAGAEDRIVGIKKELKKPEKNYEI